MVTTGRKRLIVVCYNWICFWYPDVLHCVISYSILHSLWILLPVFNVFPLFFSDNGQAHWPSTLWGCYVLCCTMAVVPGDLETLIITPQMGALRRIWPHLCQGWAAAQVVWPPLAPVLWGSPPHISILIFFKSEICVFFQKTLYLVFSIVFTESKLYKIQSQDRKRNLIGPPTVNICLPFLPPVQAEHWPRHTYT